MTRICLLGNADIDLRYELLSRETSRRALKTYSIDQPFQNSVAIDTISIGAAVSLLNDIQWYLTRFVDDAIVQEPSVSTEEWLSRDLATRIRNSDVDPDQTGEYLKIYGIEITSPEDRSGDTEDSASNQSEPEPTTIRPRRPIRRVVEPLFVRRRDDDVPEYDLRPVDDTLIVRITPEEFSL